jgi:hypothetical protein
MKIKDAVIALISVKANQRTVEIFARSEYDKKFPRANTQKGAYHSFEGFDIINEDKS